MKYLIILIAASINAWAGIPSVSTQPMVKQEISRDLTYPARVESVVNAAIYAEAAGVVTKFSKTLGQKVKKGNQMLVIQHTDPIYQFAPMSITTPVSGVVSSVKVTEGSRVEKGELLAMVTDPEKLRVVLEVAAQDAAFFKPGIQGEFKISGSDKSITMRVKGISPYVDSATGTATSELEFLLPSGENFVLAPGLVGQASFKVNRRMGYLAPEHALVYKGQDVFVRIVEEGKARRVAVVLGQKQRGQVEILKGLNDNQQLIVRASGFVGEGEEVKVEEQGKN